MKNFITLLFVVLLTGCVMPALEKADNSIKDRLEQVDTISKERVADIKSLIIPLQTNMVELSKSWEHQSEEWNNYAKQWLVESAKYREELINWRLQSDQWRTMTEKQSDQWRILVQQEAALSRATVEKESQLWRQTIQEEAERTRQFLAAQQAKATADINLIVDKLPKVLQESTKGVLDESSAKLGLKKDPETGDYSLWYTIAYSVGGLGASGGIFSIIKTMYRKKNGMEFYNPEDVDKKIEERLDAHAAEIKKLKEESTAEIRKLKENRPEAI